MVQRICLSLMLVISGIISLVGCYYHGKAFTEEHYPREYVSIFTNIKPHDYPWHHLPSITTGVYILSIDGKQVPKLFSQGMVMQEIEVLPGKHTVEIALDCDIHGMGERCSTRTMVIKVEVFPNRTYLVDARVYPIEDIWKPVLIDLKETGMEIRSLIDS